MIISGPGRNSDQPQYSLSLTSFADFVSCPAGRAGVLVVCIHIPVLVISKYHFILSTKQMSQQLEIPKDETRRCHPAPFLFNCLPSVFFDSCRTERRLAREVRVFVFTLLFVWGLVKLTSFLAAIQAKQHQDTDTVLFDRCLGARLREAADAWAKHEESLEQKHVSPREFGYGSTCHQKAACFSPCFHLPGFHLGTNF